MDAIWSVRSPHPRQPRGSCNAGGNSRDPQTARKQLLETFSEMIQIEIQNSISVVGSDNGNFQKSITVDIAGRKKRYKMRSLIVDLIAGSSRLSAKYTLAFVNSEVPGSPWIPVEIQ